MVSKRFFAEAARAWISKQCWDVWHSDTFPLIRQCATDLRITSLDTWYIRRLEEYGPPNLKLMEVSVRPSDLDLGFQWDSDEVYRRIYTKPELRSLPFFGQALALKKFANCEVGLMSWLFQPQPHGTNGIWKQNLQALANLINDELQKARARKKTKTTGRIRRLLAWTAKLWPIRTGSKLVRSAGRLAQRRSRRLCDRLYPGSRVCFGCHKMHHRGAARFPKWEDKPGYLRVAKSAELEELPANMTEMKTFVEKQPDVSIAVFITTRTESLTSLR